MFRRTRTWAHFALTFALIVVLLTTSVVFAQDVTSESNNPRPDAPIYGQLGKYLVGMRDFPITFHYKDGTTRESRVTVWYPALNPDQKIKAYTYPTEKRITDYAGTLFFPRLGHALLDAPPNLDSAPYPLVVYSHGGWGYRWFSLEYTEHLASYGFVVMATDHEDAPPVSTMPAHAEVSRQWDISALIDYAAELTSKEGALTGVINPEQIGVTGYSAGGFTTMLAGGAHRSTSEIKKWCTTDETKNSWIGPLLCVDQSARDQQWAKLLGVNVPTDGLWPDIGDKRIDVIVSMDGGAHDFGPEGLSYLRVPALLFFFRGAPGAIPYAHDTLYQQMVGKQEAIAIFENADHGLFASICNGQISSENVAACVQPVWDRQRALDLIDHLATAFLLDVLKGDKEAHKALLAENVSFPGITYETTMK